MEAKIQKLKKFNLRMGLVHLIQGAGLFYLGTVVNTGFTVPLTITQLIGVGTPEDPSSFALVPELQIWREVSNFGPAVAIFLLASAVAHKVAEWLTAINGLEYTEYPKNSPQVAAADAGELDIGMINHYYTLRVLAENGDSPVKNVYLDGGCGAMVMPAGAGVLSSSQNKPAARAFIEYLHSTSAQEHFTNEVFEFPLVPGITPNTLLPEVDSLNSPKDLNWSALALWQEKAVELIAKAGF